MSIFRRKKNYATVKTIYESTQRLPAIKNRYNAIKVILIWELLLVNHQWLSQNKGIFLTNRRVSLDSWPIFSPHGCHDWTVSTITAVTGHAVKSWTKWAPVAPLWTNLLMVQSDENSDALYTHSSILLIFSTILQSLWLRNNDLKTLKFRISSICISISHFFHILYLIYLLSLHIILLLILYPYLHFTSLHFTGELFGDLIKYIFSNLKKSIHLHWLILQSTASLVNTHTFLSTCPTIYPPPYQIVHQLPTTYP